jgi:hypothetical protein
MGQRVQNERISQYMSWKNLREMDERTNLIA